MKVETPNGSPRAGERRAAAIAGLALLAAAATGASAPEAVAQQQTPPLVNADPYSVTPQPLDSSGPRGVIPWLEEAMEQPDGGLAEGEDPDADSQVSSAPRLSPPQVIDPVTGRSQAMPALDNGASASSGAPGPAGAPAADAATARLRVPTLDDPNSGGDGAANVVEIAMVDGASPASLGAIPPQALGLPTAGWRGVDPAAAARIVSAQRPGPLAEANRLAVRLLSAGFSAPDGGAGAQLPSADPAGGPTANPALDAFLEARLTALSRFGAVDVVAGIAEAAGPERLIASRDAALAAGRDSALCRAAALFPSRDPQLHIYCRAIDGDAAGAILAIEASRELGDADQATLAFLEVVAEPDLAGYVPLDWSLDAASGLKLAAARRINLALPETFAAEAPLALLPAALAEGVPAEARLIALERLEAAGAVPTEVLANGFLGNRPEVDEGVWRRATGYRRFVRASNATLSRFAADALRRAEEDGRKLQMARLMGPTLAERIAPPGRGPDASMATLETIWVLKLSGDGRLAAQLDRALREADAAADRDRGFDDEEEAIWRGVTWLADPSGSAIWTQDDADEVIDEAEDGELQAGRLLAALDAFGAPFLEEARFPAQQAPGLGAPAARALTALAILGEDVTPAALRRALNELIAVGLADEARRIAVEAVVLAEDDD